jgi:PIN domain nuclease of toxin-antitoxin system
LGNIHQSSAEEAAARETSRTFLREQLANNNIHVLPIVLDHVARLEDLPVHHRDPFDRILVAQSMEEGWPLLSADPLLVRYPAELIW